MAANNKVQITVEAVDATKAAFETIKNNRLFVVDNSLAQDKEWP